MLSFRLGGPADLAFAVKDLTLSLNRNEILCVVGESGSGKSVMTSAIMNAVPPGLKITKGQVLSMARTFRGSPRPSFASCAVPVSP